MHCTGSAGGAEFVRRRSGRRESAGGGVRRLRRHRRLPALWAKLARRRSVSNWPGSRLLMVTLWATVRRDRPATKPVRPLRAPLDNARMSIGAFTADEVMLTMRPKPRSIIASTVARISAIGASMLASSAAIQSSRSKLRKSPGGGPPALLTRMSTCGQATSAAVRPASVVTSAATARTHRHRAGRSALRRQPAVPRHEPRSPR